MKRDAFFKEFPVERVRNDIENLSAFVTDFDYASLRLVAEEREGETFYRASDQAVQQLFNFFCHHFLYSSDRQLKNLYKVIDKWPVTTKELITRLGDLLMAFRNNIEQAEMEYFERISRDPELGRLKSNSTWVIRFQYNIEIYLDKINAEGNYVDFVKNIQNLGEKIFAWISQNEPDDIEKYKALSGPRVSERPTFNR